MKKPKVKSLVVIEKIEEPILEPIVSRNRRDKMKVKPLLLERHGEVSQIVGVEEEEAVPELEVDEAAIVLHFGVDEAKAMPDLGVYEIEAVLDLGWMRTLADLEVDGAEVVLDFGVDEAKAMELKTEETLTQVH